MKEPLNLTKKQEIEPVSNRNKMSDQQRFDKRKFFKRVNFDEERQKYNEQAAKQTEAQEQVTLVKARR